MPIKPTEAGILPVDIHDGDLDEIGNVFGGFQRSNRRMTLFAKLKEYVEALRTAGIQGWLIIDGSFVMSCVDEPGDIDIVVVLSDDWDLSANLSPFQYNLLSKRDVKRNFPFDVFPAIARSDQEKAMTDFFQQINVKWYESHGFKAGSRKGLVRIEL